MWTIRFTRLSSFLWVFGCFLFAFVFFLPVYDDPAVKLKGLLLGLVLGIIWALTASFQFEWKISKEDRKLFGFLLLIGLLLNFRQLTYGVAWRGDEDSNFDFVRIFSNLIPFQIFFLKVLGLILMGTVFKRFVKPAASLWIGVYSLIILLICYWAYQLNTINYYTSYEYNLIISRLPYLFRMMPVLPVTLAKFVGLEFQEMLYRSIAFLSMVLTAWYLARKFSGGQLYKALLIGTLFLTIPTIWYYSSVLYLEPCGVLLLSIILCNVSSWLNDPLPLLRQKPYWLALVLLPFVKETFLFVVLALLFVRFINRLFSGKMTKLTPWINEALLGIALLLPLAFYLFIREYNGNVRPAGMTFHQFANPSLYWVLLKSFWQQFSYAALLLIPALIRKMRRKEYAQILLIKVGILLISFFFVADSEGVYAGYSRFNLLLAPFFIVPVLEWLNALVERYANNIRLASVAALLLLNILLMPIRLDGAHESYWGDYYSDTSEHYYPFRDALSILKEQGVQRVYLLTNDYKPYYLRFDYQFHRVDYHPQFNIGVDMALFDPQHIEAVAAQQFVAGYQAVIVQAHVYDLQAKNAPTDASFAALLQSSAFKIEALQNAAHTLLIIQPK